MNRQTKLTAQEQAQEHLAAQQTQQQGPLEFASVEEMLRHDALHTPVPPTVANRLKESIERLPPPPRRSWWRRLFGD
jgi:hypothetical protein